MFDGGGRGGEIDDGVAACDQLERVARDRDAERPEARERAEVGADGRRIGRFDAPQTVQPGSASVARMSSRPMRPAAPITAIFKSLTPDRSAQ